MNESEKRKELLAEFEMRKFAYSGLLASTERLLMELLRIDGLRVMALRGRVKELESLSEKLGRVGKDYKQLTDVTDLAGIRIVTFFEDDVDRVAALVRREFTLVPEHCVDKRTSVEPDRFGYRSLHYVCRLTETRKSLFENAEFQNEVVEIQIRSILQHAWAEIEHDLGYKGEITIPNEIKRQLSSVAGLLEIADREFRQVRERSAAYRERISQGLLRNQVSDIQLDAISLREFVSTSKTIKSVLEVLRRDIGFTISGEISSESLLKQLQFVSIYTVEALRDEADRYADLLKEYPKVIWKNEGPDTTKIASNIPVFHLAQILALKQGGVENLNKMYDEFSMKSKGAEDAMTSAVVMRDRVQEAELNLIHASHS